MRYVRLYTDDLGVARFEDLEMDFAAADFAPPAPPVDVSSPMPAVGALFLRAPAGWSDAEHPAPVRQLMCMLSGAGEVTAGGETRQFRAGDVLLVEDTDGPGHGTTITEDAVMVVIRL
jgi:gentisate 1,2-dioxygenase